MNSTEMNSCLLKLKEQHNAILDFKAVSTLSTVKAHANDILNFQESNIPVTISIAHDIRETM